MFGTFKIRMLPDEETGSYTLFCVEDLIRATVRRPRNQTRSMSILMDAFPFDIDTYDDYTEHYVGYWQLKKAMSILRNRKMFSRNIFDEFLEWYAANVPTAVNASEVDSEEEESAQEKAAAEKAENIEQWTKIVRSRKRPRKEKEEEEDEYLEENVEMEMSSEEYEEEKEVPLLTLDELGQRGKIIQTAIDILVDVQDLPEGEDRERASILASDHLSLVESTIPSHPLFKPESKVVRVTARIKRRRPEVSQEKIKKHRKEIGELASDKHLEFYNIRPPHFRGWADGKRRRINRYTEETAPNTLDKIIDEFDFDQ